MTSHGDGHSAEIEVLAEGLAAYLAPFLSGLMKDRQGAVKTGGLAWAVWSKLGPEVEKSSRLKESAQELALAPHDPDLLVVFSIQLKRLLKTKNGLAGTLFEVMGQRQADVLGERKGGWRDLLGRDDRVIERLEMVYLLRSGKAPDEIARRMNVDVERLFRLNSRFSLAGVAGLLSEEGVGRWIDRLDGNDPVLRRLDMVGLARSGTPVSAVGREYDALPEYVERVSERFARSGIAGVLTEEEIERFRALIPATISIASYNLHGTHNDGDQTYRLRRIARELARLDPHAACLQEVLSGGGIEDTGAQISRWMSSMTGYHYRSQFSYCHQFMEKYPEGIALSSRYPPEETRTIDLTRLEGGLKPSLARNALVMETKIFGRKIIFSSVHLDHGADPVVRVAQAQKLVRELEADSTGAYFILAGDFNDLEGSPVIRFLRSAGYVDAYRACHKDAGNTYPADDPRIRIDYVFVKGHSAVVSSGLLLNDPELSDHIGIFAEIR